MDEPVKAPVRKALLRKIAWFGGDRRLVGASALIFGSLSWTLFYVYGIFWGIPFAGPGVVFLALLWVARKAYEADPYMVDVVMRQFKYNKFYAAKSDIGVNHPEIKDFY